MSDSERVPAPAITQPCFLDTPVVILFGTTTQFNAPYAKDATAAVKVYNGLVPYDFSDAIGDGFANFQFILISVLVGESMSPGSTVYQAHAYSPYSLTGFPLIAITSKRIAWSTAYTSLLLSAVTLLWAQLLRGFWWNGRYTYENPGSSGWFIIPLGWDSLLLAVYIAATVQIAYSAVAGRVSFAQS